ncbi:hypothetical protein H4R35_002958 [Dimargaris xerosporica]|nr:hypothetical protein H4R35_002958 [Dimargaris xerosporica]
MLQRFQSLVSTAVEIIAPHIQTHEEQLLDHWQHICAVYDSAYHYLLDESVYITNIPSHLEAILRCIRSEEAFYAKAQRTERPPHTETLPSNANHTAARASRALKDQLSNAIASGLHVGPCLEAVSDHQILSRLVDYAEADRPRGMRLEVVKFFTQFIALASAKCIPDSTVREPLMRLLHLLQVIVRAETRNPVADQQSSLAMHPRSQRQVPQSERQGVAAGDGDDVRARPSSAQGPARLQRGATILGVGSNRGRPQPSVVNMFNASTTSGETPMPPTTVNPLAERITSGESTNGDMEPDRAATLKRRATIAHRAASRRAAQNGALVGRAPSAATGSEDLLSRAPGGLHQELLTLIQTILHHVRRQPELISLMVDWDNGIAADNVKTPLSALHRPPPLRKSSLGSSMDSDSLTLTLDSQPAPGKIIVNVPAQAQIGGLGAINLKGQGLTLAQPLETPNISKPSRIPGTPQASAPCFLILDILTELLVAPTIRHRLIEDCILVALDTMATDPNLTHVVIHHCKLLEVLGEQLSYLYAVMPFRHSGVRDLDTEQLHLNNQGEFSGTLRRLAGIRTSAKSVLANIFTDEGNNEPFSGPKLTTPSPAHPPARQGQRFRKQTSVESQLQLGDHQVVQSFFALWQFVDQVACVCEGAEDVVLALQNHIIHAFLQPTLTVGLSSTSDELACVATQYVSEMIRITRSEYLMEAIFYALLGEDFTPERPTPSPKHSGASSPAPRTESPLSKPASTTKDDVSNEGLVLSDADAFLASALNISIQSLSVSAIAEDWVKSVSLAQDGVDSEAGRASSCLYDVPKTPPKSLRDTIIDRILAPNDKLRLATLQLFDTMLETCHQFACISLVLRNFMVMDPQTPLTSSFMSALVASSERGNDFSLSGSGGMSPTTTASFTDGESGHSDPHWLTLDDTARRRLAKQANDNRIKRAIVERFLGLIPVIESNFSFSRTKRASTDDPAKPYVSPWEPPKNLYTVELGQEDYIVDAQSRNAHVHRIKAGWLPFSVFLKRVAQYNPLSATVASTSSHRSRQNSSSAAYSPSRSSSQLTANAPSCPNDRSFPNENWSNPRQQSLSDHPLPTDVHQLGSASRARVKELHVSTDTPMVVPYDHGLEQDLMFPELYPGRFIATLLSALSRHLEHHIVENLLVTGLICKMAALDEPALTWYLCCACQALDSRLGKSFDVDCDAVASEPLPNTTLSPRYYLYDVLQTLSHDAYHISLQVPNFETRLYFARQRGVEYRVDDTGKPAEKPNTAVNTSMGPHPGAKPVIVTVPHQQSEPSQATSSTNGPETASQQLTMLATLSPQTMKQPPALTTSIKRFVNAHIVLQEFCKEMAAFALVNQLE